jgi:hypothetical protein
MMMEKFTASFDFPCNFGSTFMHFLSRLDGGNPIYGATENLSTTVQTQGVPFTEIPKR